MATKQSMTTRAARKKQIDEVRKRAKWLSSEEANCYKTLSFNPIMVIPSDMGHFWMISELKSPKVLHNAKEEKRFFLNLMGGSDYTAVLNNVEMYKAQQENLIKLDTINNILHSIYFCD